NQLMSGSAGGPTRSGNAHTPTAAALRSRDLDTPLKQEVQANICLVLLPPHPQRSGKSVSPALWEVRLPSALGSPSPQRSGKSVSPALWEVWLPSTLGSPRPCCECCEVREEADTRHTGSSLKPSVA